MEYKTIRYEVSDGLALLTLNRPHRNNAWTGRMETEYHHAMDAAERDGAVGAVVITGEGKNFCVGADSQALEKNAAAGEYDSGLREPLRDPGDPNHPAYGTRHAFPLAMSKLVVSAVNGAAAGIGFVVPCFSDIRIVADNVKLTAAASKLGLPGEHAVHWMLPRLIGHGRAFEILLSSRIVGADEALRIGLAHAVHPAEEVFEKTCEYTRTLLDTVAPVSIRTLKAQMTHDLVRPIGESAAEAVDLIDELTRTPDYQRGIRAFSKREPPRFLEMYR